MHFFSRKTGRDPSLYELNILGDSGLSINDAMLKGKKIARSDFSGNEIKIFDYYNTNKEGGSKDFLDETELQFMLQDLISADKDGNSSFLPVEMKKFIEDKNLGKKINSESVVNFIKKIVNYCDIEDLSKNSDIDFEILLNVSDEDVANLILDYETKTDISLVEKLCQERKSTRDNTLRNIKEKLISYAEKCGIETEEFNTKFDSILSSISDKRDKKNITKLDNLVDDFIAQLKEKEAVYKSNKNGIINMLSDSKLCYSTGDLDAVIDNIMKYANEYNPKKSLEGFTNINNKNVKKIVQNLLDSKLLDYYPIFLASVIAQESQFREQDDKVFTNNGKGVMQITRALIDDMYNRSGLYNDEFIEAIKTEYPDSTKLYEAINTPENVELNYQAGAVGLNGKLFDAIRMVASGKYKSLKIDTPEKLLQLVVMNYNSNKAAKKDPVYKNKLSQVRYVYSRDVMLRFRRFTPQGVTVSNYYEYNPNIKGWVYK